MVLEATVVWSKIWQKLILGFVDKFVFEMIVGWQQYSESVNSTKAVALSPFRKQGYVV